MNPAITPTATARRQTMYWHLLAQLITPEEPSSLSQTTKDIVTDAHLPAALVDSTLSVSAFLQRFPEFTDEFTDLLRPPSDGPEDGDLQIRRAALVSFLLSRVLARTTGAVTTAQLAQWQHDATYLEQALGCQPGGLKRSPEHQEIAAELAGIEADLVHRMALPDVLADPALAQQLTPSMHLVSQILREKNHLSGEALKQAKRLIAQFVDQVAEVLRTQVEQASVGIIDRSIPPRRTFRNLDIKRTIWKNLPHYDATTGTMQVDQLYFRHTAKLTTPQRLIVVVDQSGSMVSSMVNCTILASIFAGIPHVDVHLVAYDTRSVNLTPWVRDPFEALLRTDLGGGTDGRVAMTMIQPLIEAPRQTAVIWISDFYEWNCEELFTDMAALHQAGVKFIPVGSVSSSGRAEVNSWFKDKFKDQGTPVISGHITKLIVELKNFLA